MPSKEQWEKLSWRDQIGHIAAEIKRAGLMQDKNKELYLQMLERAMALVDLSLNDFRQRENIFLLLNLKSELGKAYLGEINADRLYAIL